MLSVQGAGAVAVQHYKQGGLPQMHKLGQSIMGCQLRRERSAKMGARLGHIAVQP